MPRRLTLAASLVAILATAGSALAAPAVTDTLLLQLTSAVREGLERVPPDSIPAAQRARIDDLAGRLEFAARSSKPTLGMLARGSGERFGDRERRATDVESLQLLFNTYVRKFVRRTPDDSSGREILVRFERLGNRELALSQKRTLERLRRYEIRYGPGSARLNFVEAMLNYVAQGWSHFGPDGNGPGELEWVAAYSTSYGTVDDDEAEVLSGIELGLRWYNLRFEDAETFGRERRKSFVPHYVTFGVLVSEERDGALRWPWRNDRKPRTGPFVTWGAYKAAYLFGSESRFAFSRQFQVLPHVF